MSVTASSGHAKDIQDAVDYAVAQGLTDVLIPEGIFNFYEIGETWVPVNASAGINIFGAPTQRTSGLSVPPRGRKPNDQVINYRTILQMPFEIAGYYFVFNGDGNPSKPSRLSDIEFYGYRNFDPTSEITYDAAKVTDILDFRIDHCFLNNVPGGIDIWGTPSLFKNRGVIDHCSLINDYGVPEPYPGTIGYGILNTFSVASYWDPDLNNILGKYTDYTLFVEDCLFSRWRHCITSGHGAHYVFRHNTIEQDCGFGSIDAHGTFELVGTRCIELYKNEIIDPINRFCGYDCKDPALPSGPNWGVFWRGGAGVAFDNHVRIYKTFIEFSNEGNVEKCWPHDVYIWGNALEQVQYLVGGAGPVEGVDFFLYEKPGYVPYPYPHPLTLGIPYHNLSVNSNLIGVPFKIRSV